MVSLFQFKTNILKSYGQPKCILQNVDDGRLFFRLNWYLSFLMRAAA